MIVVIILGILAAVAIPQFGDSTDDAKLSTLEANLGEMRNSAELYYHQHNTSYPVSEVTYMVGFNDRKHFSREFKKVYNLSPSVYKKCFLGSVTAGILQIRITLEDLPALNEPVIAKFLFELIEDIKVPGSSYEVIKV